MTRTSIFLADLTHTATGISALAFPLGTAFVASYAESILGDEFEFELFKFPDEAAEAVLAKKPRVIGFSNYAWNLELGYGMAAWVKRKFPETVIVFGGPNFPIVEAEQKAFLKNRSHMDFYIQNEGEIGFVDLLRGLAEHDFDLDAFRKDSPVISNCCFLNGDRLVRGDVERILDVNNIPSPYLSGMLDKFFDAPLAPMIETTRGCPFSCAFCADGLESKNRIVRFDHERVKDELYYIAKRVKNVDEITITDLNFGMYKQDLQTAETIAEVQKKFGWPVIIGASAGKNQPKRVIETASLLKGSWLIGSAVQSTDEEVLKNIKRGNISIDAYRQFIDFANQRSKDSESYTEIILALPGDTKEKHFNSLRAGIDNKVSTLRMYQAMLLLGTSMASQETREKFGLLTKYRILPGCIGVYRFGDDEVPVAEIEEIAVGGRDMPFEDYVSCRVMNLLVETYINNGLFEEMFAALGAMGVATFDVLVHLHENPGLYSPRMAEVVERFVRETVDDLYDSHAEAKEFALAPGNTEKFLSGELGGNELLDHRALLYLELEDIAGVLMKSIAELLEEEGLWDDGVAKFFEQLKSFTICKKKRIHESAETVKERFDFDFKALSSVDFSADPRRVKTAEKGVDLQFFHTPDQQKYIKNAVSLYENHPGGIARMIQRNNLKMMYRHFEYA